MCIHILKKGSWSPKKSHLESFKWYLILTSWYLETPPLTAASMTPFRHMVKGLIFCICLVWHWLIRVFSCWFLFSNTSIAFSRGLISTWEANEHKYILDFVTFKKKVDYSCSEWSVLPVGSHQYLYQGPYSKIDKYVEDKLAVQLKVWKAKVIILIGWNVIWIISNHQSYISSATINVIQKENLSISCLLKLIYLFFWRAKYSEALHIIITFLNAYLLNTKHHRRYKDALTNPLMSWSFQPTWEDGTYAHMDPICIYNSTIR